MKHQRYGRALTMLLTLMLVMGLLPTTVFAANTARVQINGQALQDGVSVQCGEGTAVLDEANGTLTLENATISPDPSAPQGTPVFRADSGELKIILIGTNTITSAAQKAFYCGSVNLTIQGTENDSLTVKTDSDGLQVDNGNLTVDGCRMDITSTTWAASCVTVW